MINKVTLVGRVGKAPEIKTLDNGLKVASFTLATSDNYKDKSGEWVENTEWHRITVWAAFAERAGGLVPGTLIYLEGKIQTKKWQDKEGKDRYSTEITGNYYRVLKKAGEDANYSEVVGDDSKEELPF